MRKGVNFNVFSPGSHTDYLLWVGWLTCILVSWAASSLFQFHLSRQGFGLPCSGRQCEISCLDLIVLCWVYFREKNTCSLRVGIQGSCKCTARLRIWTSVLARSGFCSVSVDFNTLEWWISRLGSFQVTHGSIAIDQPWFLLLSVEHKWKTTALICQEIHLRTLDSYITYSCCYGQLW